MLESVQFPATNTVFGGMFAVILSQLLRALHFGFNSDYELRISAEQTSLKCR